MNKRVTLREIAEAAGVHYSTISLALRDHPNVSVPVREKIKKLASDMGYTPDPALSALNAYRKTKLTVHYQSTLAWIDNWEPTKLRAASTFNEYYTGAATRARQLGYELEEFCLEKEGISPERASRILHSRGIKGLLLAPQPESGMRLPFDYERFSSVTFGYSLQPRVFHLVTNHQFHSLTLALDKLTELNYKRIGMFIPQDIDEKVDNMYLSAHWNFYRKHKKARRIEPCLYKAGGSRPAFPPWFQKHKPDVIMSFGGIPVLEMLENMGLNVPGDVGYIQLSVGSNEPEISGVYENGLLIGRTAVDFLVGMLQRGEMGFPEVPIRIQVEGSWRQGKTVREPAGCTEILPH
ncbi:MAG: LacI family DNA-binding transcriptional regulator [Candidatus Methylacidiphilales bacterium]|nr:LacI family DNA-binding transcriptional regulator [Candidatus Methylacidiphilales bacterium]